MGSKPRSELELDVKSEIAGRRPEDEGKRQKVRGEKSEVRLEIKLDLK